MKIIDEFAKITLIMDSGSVIEFDKTEKGFEAFLTVTYDLIDEVKAEDEEAFLTACTKIQDEIEDYCLSNH